MIQMNDSLGGEGHKCFVWLVKWKTVISAGMQNENG